MCTQRRARGARGRVRDPLPDPGVPPSPHHPQPVFGALGEHVRRRQVEWGPADTAERGRPSVIRPALLGKVMEKTPRAHRLTRELDPGGPWGAGAALLALPAPRGCSRDVASTGDVVLKTPAQNEATQTVTLILWKTQRIKAR